MIDSGWLSKPEALPTSTDGAKDTSGLAAAAAAADESGGMRATGGDNNSSADDDEAPAVEAPALTVEAAPFDEAAAAAIEEVAGVCACVGEGCDTSLNGVRRTGDGGGCASVRDSAAESTARA